MCIGMCMCLFVCKEKKDPQWRGLRSSLRGWYVPEKLYGDTDSSVCLVCCVRVGRIPGIEDGSRLCSGGCCGVAYSRMTSCGGGQ